MRCISHARALAGLGLAFLLVEAGAPLRASAQSPVLEILQPLPDAVTLAGSVRVAGTLGGSAAARVLYVVDVSGSTGSPSGLDCSGDGAVDDLDDYNGDGTRGDVLDCEISGVTALHASLLDSGAHFGLIGFGSSARLGDVSSDDGVTDFVEASFDGPDADGQHGLPDVLNVATSLRRGTIGLFTSYGVGTGTSFNNALREVADAFAGEPSDARRVAFFLSDGESSVSTGPGTALQAVLDEGAVVHTFGVGSNASTCDDDAPLGVIARMTGGACRHVEDPTALSAAIGSVFPQDFDIEVELSRGTDGTRLGPFAATISAIGDWDVVFTGVGPGRWAAFVRLTHEGELISSHARFFDVVEDDRLSYVALGDSYSAGEGIFPRLDVLPTDEPCHRAKEAWPRLVVAPGSDEPIATHPATADLFRFAACSSAVIRNLAAVEQNAGGTRVPLQLSFVTPGTDLVTMTMGGNDANFSDILAHCATQFDCFNDGFRSLNLDHGIRLVDWVHLRLALLSAQLPNTYRLIRTASNFDATVVIASYPELFNSRNRRIFLCPEFGIWGPEERADLNNAARAFEAVIASATAEAGVDFVPVADEFLGKGVCGEGVAGDEWITGVDASWNPTKPNAASFHPTEKGARAYARLVSELLADETRAARREAAATEQVAADEDEVVEPEEIRIRAAALEPFFGALPALSDEAIMQTLAIELDAAGVQSLAALAGTEAPECDGVAVARQHLIVNGEGFAPGTLVDVAFTSAVLGDLALGQVAADGEGKVRFGLVVPSSVNAAATAAGIRLTGTSPSGSRRRLLTLILLEGPDSACASRALSTGQISVDGGPAPAAAALGLGDPLLSVADPVVTELSLRRVRFRIAAAGRRGSVHAVGTYAGPILETDDGLVVTVQTAEGIVVGASFDASECRSLADGTLRCIAGEPTGEERPRVRLAPVRRGATPTAEWRATLWIPSSDVELPLTAPARVVVSTPSRHLLGDAEDCRPLRRGALVRCIR